MARTSVDTRREAIIALRRQGWSFRLIAGELDIPASTVRRYAQDTSADEGTVRRTRYDLREAPTPLPPSETLAYFWGVFAGDGSLSLTSRAYKLSISCDARYPDLIQVYASLIETLIGKTPRVVPRKAGSYFEVWVHGAYLSTLLKIPSGNKAENGFTIPEWIFDRPEYVRPFLRGLIETDGGIYHEYRNGGWCSRCFFTAKHSPIMEAFLRGTRDLGYEFRRCGIQARLTRTAQVKRLAAELDVTKNRVYN